MTSCSNICDEAVVSYKVLFSHTLQPLQQTEWYGNPRGYNISYRKSTEGESWRFQTIGNPTGNSFVLNDLEEFSTYEVKMAAFNDVGSSELSVPSVERTRESGNENTVYSKIL